MKKAELEKLVKDFNSVVEPRIEVEFEETETGGAVIVKGSNFQIREEYVSSTEERKTDTKSTKKKETNVDIAETSNEALEEACFRAVYFLLLNGVDKMETMNR